MEKFPSLKEIADSWTKSENCQKKCKIVPKNPPYLSFNDCQEAIKEGLCLDYNKNNMPIKQEMVKIDNSLDKLEKTIEECKKAIKDIQDKYEIIENRINRFEDLLQLWEGSLLDFKDKLEIAKRFGGLEK